MGCNTTKSVEGEQREEKQRRPPRFARNERKTGVFSTREPTARHSGSVSVPMEPIGVVNDPFLDAGDFFANSDRRGSHQSLHQSGKAHRMVCPPPLCVREPRDSVTSDSNPCSTARTVPAELSSFNPTPPSTARQSTEPYEVAAVVDAAPVEMDAACVPVHDDLMDEIDAHIASMDLGPE